jgi:uncharacterized membrane protein YfcA
MGRRWAIEIAGGVVVCAGLAWLFNSQPRPHQLGAMLGATLVVVGLIAVLQRVTRSPGCSIGLGSVRRARQSNDGYRSRLAWRRWAAPRCCTLFVATN